ncbi:hypothetical protein ABPG75_013986 [Micractinium tetrahymenae]
MCAAFHELNILNTHHIDDLVYLGEDSTAKQMAAAADVLLITAQGHELPAHRVYLLRHSRVLASMFDAMDSTVGAASTSSGASAAPTSATAPRRSARGRSKQRQGEAAAAAQDGGGGGSSGAGPCGGSGAVGAAAAVGPFGRLRLETPFKEYATDTVIDFLIMVYDTASIADHMVERMMGNLSEASTLLRLCDQLDAADCLRLLDAALEKEAKDIEQGYCDWHDIGWSLEAVQVAERWQGACPQWFDAVLARLGAELARVHDNGDYLLPIQQLMMHREAAELRPETLLKLWGCAAASQREGLSRVRRMLGDDEFKPRFHFTSRMSYETSVEASCRVPEGGMDEHAVQVVCHKFRHHGELWQVLIQQKFGSWWVAAQRAPGSHRDESRAYAQHLAVTCTICSTSGNDVTTEHSITVDHSAAMHTTWEDSHLTAISLKELRDSAKGFIGPDGKVRICLRVRSTCLDM